MEITRTPYLIQRGMIRKNDKISRLSDMVDFDYMGSSEFEFGALPRSLRALQANVDSISSTVEGRITGDNGESLRVLHTFSPEDYEVYFGHLTKLREGKLRTKESTRFSVEDKKWFSSQKCDFWWDIENHVMWTFKKHFMKQLPDALAESWKYMDRNKVK